MREVLGNLGTGFMGRLQELRLAKGKESASRHQLGNVPPQNDLKPQLCPRKLYQQCFHSCAPFLEIQGRDIVM